MEGGGGGVVLFQYIILIVDYSLGIMEKKMETAML